jgi:peroxidase
MATPNVVFYPPWIGPHQLRIWSLITIVVAGLVIGLLYIPIITCAANDSAGVCAGPVEPPVLQGLETVGLPLKRGCACNTSTTTRTETNARVLSNTVFLNGETPPTPEARGLSALTVTVAQFVLNDIAFPRPSGNAYNVLVAYPDPFFTPTPVNMSVPTWVTAADGQGCPNPLSDTTPFLDLSNVYGVDPSFLFTQLRSQRNGRLNVSLAGDLPPLWSQVEGSAFILGDPRDGYTADVVALHTVLIRNHNAWAARVQGLHPEWNDDQVFWKARQLNVAEWQHILFHEWLPALLGSLAPATRSTLSSYNPSIPSAVDVEVSAVVMPSLIDTLTPATYGTLPWASQYGVTTAATLVQTEGISPMLGRLVKTAALAFDARVSNALRNIYNGSEPVDYVVRHLQRARIVRIPDWAAIYTCFGTTPIAGDPRDAYQGFLQEIIYPGASEGLTGGSMLGGQFSRLRDSDPYFYSFRRVEIGQLLWPEVVRGSMRGLLFRNAVLGPNDIGTGNVFFAQQ